MDWSQGMSDTDIAKELRIRLRKALVWIRQHTKRTIFVIEPVNEMPSRHNERAIVVKAMKAEVAHFKGAVWLPMAWKDADLQRVRCARKGLEDVVKSDPRHFNCRAARRIASEVARMIR